MWGQYSLCGKNWRLTDNQRIKWQVHFWRFSSVVPSPKGRCFGVLHIPRGTLLMVNPRSTCQTCAVSGASEHRSVRSASIQDLLQFLSTLDGCILSPFETPIALIYEPFRPTYACVLLLFWITVQLCIAASESLILIINGSDLSLRWNSNY